MGGEGMNVDLMERERAMLRDPSLWPRWPLLPLVKRNGQMSDDDHCAIMFADRQLERPVIYIGLLLEVTLAAKRLGATDASAGWGDVLGKFPRREFNSLDELMATYRVD